MQWVLVGTCGDGKLLPVLVIALRGEGGREERGVGGIESEDKGRKRELRQRRRRN